MFSTRVSETSGRRDFLKVAGASTATMLLSCVGGNRSLQAADRKPLPVAAVVTVYRKNSHTDVLVGKILEGWQQTGGTGPDLKLASMYVDQVGKDDLSRKMADRFGFRIARTIDEAITLGSDKVQVSGVLSIGEHGDYPFTPDTRQQMYPRRRFFDAIVAAFQRGGQNVPIFNDKHLGYRWEDAKHMYDTARKLQIPLLAGSSVPLAWRFPALELNRDEELESAVTVGWDGLEIYGIHALEAHQAMIERRRGGESGVTSVQALRGEAIHQAAAEKRWSVELFDAALARLPGKPQIKPDWVQQPNAALFLLEHRDGLKSAVAMIGSLTQEFAFAGRVKGRAEPVSTWIRLQNGPPFGHFAQQLRAIEETIHTGRAVYPAERTLLTTGVLDRLMHSVAAGSRQYATPELNIAYQPSDWPFANHPQTRLVLPELD